MPHTQSPFLPLTLTMSLVVRSAGDPSLLTEAIRREVRAVDLNQPVFQVLRMEEVVSAAIASRRFSMLLLGLFAAIALVLATIGLYGVISYAVGQRTREIGIRMSLGAGPLDIARNILGRGAVLLALGIVIGTAASWALAQQLSRLLFQVKPRDAMTFVAVGLLLLTVGLVATWLPARRAARIDPSSALRYE
jgi:putative ABC transport system permease protein